MGLNRERIAVSLDHELIERLDLLVQQKAFPSRSRAIEQALAEKIERLNTNSLARALEQVDPEFEKAMAEEGMAEDFAAWPEY